MAKSKYLVENWIRSDNYFLFTFKPYVTFEKGQENEFIEAIYELRDYYKKSGHMDLRVNDTLKYIMKISDLDWNMIWQKTNIDEYFGPLDEYIACLLNHIEWKTFKDKVNQSNNYIVVHILYHLYCRDNEISSKKEHAAYEEYLTIFFERTKKTPESILFKMIIDYTNSFERRHDVGSYFYDSKYEIFKMLILRSNLDTIIQFENKNVSLKNLLFYRILKHGSVSDWLGDSDDPSRADPCLKVDNKKSLNVLFSACNDFIFSGEPLNSDFNDYDRATLTYMTKYIEDALEIFDNKEYPIYDQNQLNSLLETGIYQANNSPFIDRFATMVKFICIDNPKAILENGATRPEFMEFIYSPKIRIISYATLMIIKNYLSEKEFNDYLKYINTFEIQIYFGDYLGLHSDSQTTSDCVTSPVLSPTYISKLGTSIIDGVKNTSPLSTNVYFKNYHSLFDNQSVIMTLNYATHANLNFMDQAKLDAIMKELNIHTSGEVFKK